MACRAKEVLSPRPSPFSTAFLTPMSQATKEKRGRRALRATKVTEASKALLAPPALKARVHYYHTPSSSLSLFITILSGVPGSQGAKGNVGARGFDGAPGPAGPPVCALI